MKERNAPKVLKDKRPRRKNSRRDHMTQAPSVGYLETQAYLAQHGEWQ